MATLLFQPLAHDIRGCLGRTCHRELPVDVSAGFRCAAAKFSQPICGDVAGEEVEIIASSVSRSL
jgi:hypothetical protein